MTSAAPPYQPTNKVRVVTATSLFDGHDAAINIMRRILQRSGVEVIHLGHHRSVHEIVETAIQEDVQAVAVTSYQGGHLEFFRYLHDLLGERGAGDVRIFGGGGGTILPDEARELHSYGIARIYSPDDGRSMGFQGMIDDMLAQADFPRGDRTDGDLDALSVQTPGLLARMISAAENHPDSNAVLLAAAADKAAMSTAPVLGITGTGGSGKSSLVDEVVRRYLADFPDKTIAVISVDPSKRKGGGALLGDRIRMNAIVHPRAYMRSLATRQPNLALSPHIGSVVDLVKAAGYDLVILETSGIGQSDTEIVDHSDLAAYVMTPEYGAASQLEKIDMIDLADAVVINKADRQGADDALRDVRKQFRRNHLLFDAEADDLPVYGTIASQFNDPGTNRFYLALTQLISQKTELELESRLGWSTGEDSRPPIIPKSRSRYLSEVAETVRAYNASSEEQAAAADTAYGLQGAIDVLGEGAADAVAALAAVREAAVSSIDPDVHEALDTWDEERARYQADEFSYEVRGKRITVEQYTETLSHNRIPKVAFPRMTGPGDRVRWLRAENLPGRFPFTAGVFPFKRMGEDPARMFAGEGGPEQTNRRFHYLSAGLPTSRLSTAFDSVTLYGNDPDRRPDIYGKVGNSGVSIASVDDAKRLYSGFDLVDPSTSVSMTINGPAPMILAFFLNAAIDQQCEKWLMDNDRLEEAERTITARYDEIGAERPRYFADLPEGNDGLGLRLLGVSGDQVVPPEVYARIKEETLHAVRGTVQADILKEDQAQNTCIFSTEFALRMQGDIQQYFVDHGVRNFYSVSISGYHMAEAGANPITQVAFTLANAFTFVEHYTARGMDIDAFAPNLSFFFSNGLDAEYAVIGRVARRIWAKVMRDLYGADERSQKLKYHIQTSGRSLHAQEISFNDIRTTLQALYAIYDNTNSLHTNAFDEAITTPTEDSVRRALAIQLIINNELGLAKNENPLQGSFIIEELTDLVEAAVLAEFDRISDRGGVLGAMETMYQRTRIQEESLHYEQRKASGELPVIGVNTFLSSTGSPIQIPDEVIRSTDEDKDRQIASIEAFRARNAKQAEVALDALAATAVGGGNIFEALMEASKVCSLGQLANALYGVGGQYRRNM